VVAHDEAAGGQFLQDREAATNFSHARNNATVCRSYRMCHGEQTKVRRCRPRPDNVEIKEICMRRTLLELLRKPVNTGVAIGLLIGLCANKELRAV
jgi:hypothetical protein